MLFNSPIFLFVFLPLFLVLYFIVKDKWKNLTILLASLIFYTWGEKELVILLLGSALIDYTCSLIIEKGKSKTGLFLSLCFNLGILFLFKYSDFTAENFNSFLDFTAPNNPYRFKIKNILLPLGISFYTFQTMSYTIDVYMGKIKACRNFIAFATYVTFFPQLIAGPIVRFQSIQKQLIKRRHNWVSAAEGLERFIIGLTKKLVFANTFAAIADGIFAIEVGSLSSPLAWLGLVSFTLQIYFDFSAYTDMAIGLARILGFTIPENFAYPYLAKSIRSFWQKWHISLSTWFRDYVYIPLGGSRVSQHRTLINLLIVFLITGLWHGASWNFIIWGLWHGLFIVLERAGLESILKKLGPLQHIYTMTAVLLGWLIFRITDLSQLLYLLQKLMSADDSNVPLAYFLGKSELIILVLGLILCCPIYSKIRSLLTRNKFIKMSYYVVLLIGLIYNMGLLAADTYNPFIYFRF